MLVDKNEEIDVEDVEKIEAELGIDIDEYDYYSDSVMHHW